MKDYDRAIADYSEAIRLKPDDERALIDRGVSFDHKHDFAHAISDYDKAIELVPNDAQAFVHRALAFDHQQDFAHAIADYDKAIALRPDSAVALNNRCWTRAEANIELEPALADCTEAHRLAPDKDSPLGSIGFVYFRMGNFDKAVASQDAALAINPTSADALYMRGMARKRNGDAAGGAADIAAAKSIIRA